MRSLAALVLLVGACGQSAPAKAPQAPPAQSVAPTRPSPAEAVHNADFAAFPAAPYTGARRLPDFNGAQRAFREFRTALSEGAAQGPNFAGRYALVQIGCGAGCNETYQVDLSNGGVAPIHFADETAVEIQSRADSALLKTRWFVTPSDPNGQYRCHFENYVWRDDHLARLGQADADGPCPE